MQLAERLRHHAYIAGQELRFAWRRLAHAPAFTTIAVAILGLAIAANTAIFSVVDRLVVHPLPYADPARLVDVEVSPLAIDPSIRAMEPPEYFVLRDENRTLVDVGLYQTTSADRDVTVTGTGEAERLHAIRATDGVLYVLDVEPALGRRFTRADDVPRAAPTVMLGFDYWQRRFGGSAAAVGSLITIDGVARQIIGVLPRGFRLLNGREADLMLPLQLDRAAAVLGTFSYSGIARLRPGVTAARAAADLARLMPRVLASFPPIRGSTLELFQHARLTPMIRPLADVVIGDLRPRLWLLMAGVALVLVIACANVANLLLIRADGRRGELALRAALGATRGRIVQHLFSETAIIAAFAGCVGGALAYAGLKGLVAAIPGGLPHLDQIVIAPSAIAFNIAAATATSVLTGLLPVLRLRDDRATLASAGRGGGQTRDRRRAQRALVGVQVALALVLVACSTLMLRSFRALAQVEPGFSRAADVQALRVPLTQAVVREDARVPLVEEQIRSALAAIPRVEAVSFGTSIPLDGAERYDNIYAEDRPAETAPPLRRETFIAPGYFATLGIRLVAGRDLDAADIHGGRAVALVSAAFARDVWGSPLAAIGRRIRPSSRGEWYEIVGVTADVHDEAVDQAPRPTVYWPVRAANFGGATLQVQRYVTFVLRTPAAGTPALVAATRRAIAAVNAGAAVSETHTLDELYARSMSRTTLMLLMLGIAGLMALVLGATGIYGVVAHTVAQRRSEIGVRLALGASPGSILRLIIGQGMSVVGVGLVVGIVGAIVTTRFMSSVIFAIRPTDPLTYALVVPLLALVGFVACALPAARAMRIAPAVALRDR